MFAEAPKNLAKVDRKFKCKWLVDQSEGALPWDTMRRLDSEDEKT